MNIYTWALFLTQTGLRQHLEPEVPRAAAALGRQEHHLLLPLPGQVRLQGLPQGAPAQGPPGQVPVRMGPVTRKLEIIPGNWNLNQEAGSNTSARPIDLVKRYVVTEDSVFNASISIDTTLSNSDCQCIVNLPRFVAFVIWSIAPRVCTVRRQPEPYVFLHESYFFPILYRIFTQEVQLYHDFFIVTL